MDDLQDKKKYESEIYQNWIDQGCFKPSYNFDKNFSICIPPPNVTGSLHMGHALNNTIQDILVRYHRMNGFNTYGNRALITLVLLHKWLWKEI